MRDLFKPGAKFRVLKEGTSLTGMVSTGPYAWKGWGRQLAVGEILTCRGYCPGFGSDPIQEVMFDDAAARAAHASCVTFSASSWGTPLAGYLELVEESR